LSSLPLAVVVVIIATIAFPFTYVRLAVIVVAAVSVIVVIIISTLACYYATLAVINIIIAAFAFPFTAARLAAAIVIVDDIIASIPCAYAMLAVFLSSSPHLPFHRLMADLSPSSLLPSWVWLPSVPPLRLLRPRSRRRCSLR
jgi:signal transduction histidine kinase